MLILDPKSVAINAAGIADAFRLCQICDDDGTARVGVLSESYRGWIGVMEAVSEAAECVEAYRVRHGMNTTWGGELPYIYEVWDSVARMLWNRLESGSIDEIVRVAIEQTIADNDD